jgi:hypothetical protein
MEDRLKFIELYNSGELTKSYCKEICKKYNIIESRDSLCLCKIKTWGKFLLKKLNISDISIEDLKMMLIENKN